MLLETVEKSGKNVGSELCSGVEVGLERNVIIKSELPQDLSWKLFGARKISRVTVSDPSVAGAQRS